MAIKIPQNMIFGTPNIKLITDNKINKVDYQNNIISNINHGTTNSSFELKSIFSTNVNCWTISEDGKYYDFNGYHQNDGVVWLDFVELNGKYEYYAQIDLNKIKSDTYYSIINPYDIAYIGVEYSAGAVKEYFPKNEKMWQRINAEGLEMEDVSKNYVSSSTRGNDKLYTVENKVDINTIVARTFVFDPILEFEPQKEKKYYVDEISGRLSIHIGTITKGTESNVGTGQVVFNFSLNFYYPSFNINEVKMQQTSLVDGVIASNYTMETNSFMNSYIDVNGDEVNFVDNQAKEIMFNYENGRLKANITCNYGKYLNDDGTIAYSGNDGKTIKIGDIVQLNLSKINKNFEVIKSEIVYSGNIRVNLTLEEISKVFGIYQKVGSGLSITYNRIYSEIGSIGNITNNDKLYENDVIQINANPINNAYSLDSLIVNGESFANGNLITITKDLNVYATSSVKTYSISSTIGQGATLILTRESSHYGKGELGTINVNDTLYYGDIINVSWTLDNGYGTDTAYLNGERIYLFNTNKITIESNITIEINTKTIGYEEIWNGEYNYLYEDLTSNETLIELPTSINTRYGLRLTFDRVVLYNVKENASADEITNITREIPFTLSSEFGNWWSSKPSITFEYKKLEVETTKQLKTIRLAGIYDSQKYMVGSFRLSKIEQYYD